MHTKCDIAKGLPTFTSQNQVFSQLFKIIKALHDIKERANFFFYRKNLKNIYTYNKSFANTYLSNKQPYLILGDWGARIYVTYFTLSNFLAPLIALSFYYTKICGKIRRNLQAKKRMLPRFYSIETTDISFHFSIFWQIVCQKINTFFMSNKRSLISSCL